MLEKIEAFLPSEVSCALELVDLALDKPEQPDYRVLVADQGGTLVGYICYGPTPMTDGTFDLYWVASSNEARGTGVGRALVLAMEEQLRQEKARMIRVETSSLSEYGPARQFYARLDYSVTAEIPDFYRPGDALVTLTKRVG